MNRLRVLVLTLLVAATSSGRTSLRFFLRGVAERKSWSTRQVRVACFGYLFVRSGAFEDGTGRDEFPSYDEGSDGLSYPLTKENETGASGLACMGYLCIRGGAFISPNEEFATDSEESGTLGDEERNDGEGDAILRQNETAAANETAMVPSLGGTNSSIVSVDCASAPRGHEIFGTKVRRGSRMIKERWDRTRSKTAAFGKQTMEQWSNWTWAGRTTAQDRRQFLDRIALIGSALIRSERDAVLSKETDHDDDFMGHDDEVTHQSDLLLPGRRIYVVTTAALPWFTGTAVNPLLRAAHLCRKTWEINNPGYRPTVAVEDEPAKQGNIDRKQWVTLVIPWLELEEDRLELYGQNHLFANQQEQENYIRAWMREEADLAEEADTDTGLNIIFYPARYHEGMKSIFAMGDICSLIPDSDADVCILEEPEHLNWYRAPGDGWTKKFNYVVGVVHTNYKEYASTQYHGLWTAPALGIMSSAMIRAYCHKVIKLSDVLQTFAPEKEKTSNVHGVRSEFLREGRRRATEESHVLDSNQTESYFIGKILWAKGLDKMLEMQRFYRQCTGDYFQLDIYGSGPDLHGIMRAFHGRKHYTSMMRQNGEDASQANSLAHAENGTESDTELMLEASDSDDIYVGDESPPSCDEDEDRVDVQLQQRLAATREKLAKISQTIISAKESLELDLPMTHHELLRRTPIPAEFPGRVDHALLKEQYKVFVNPSITEVLCTTTAEALAMGKFAIIPDHPSNKFFLQFPNCLAYRNKWEFAANLNWALSHEPEPLTAEQSYRFSWEAATDRFIDAAAITRREAREREQLGTTKLDERIAWFHNVLGKGAKGDVIRAMCGGGPISNQVRYETERKQAEILAANVVTDEIRARSVEGADESEGLPMKLRRSTFAEAIRSTLSNLVPLNVAPAQC